MGAGVTALREQMDDGSYRYICQCGHMVKAPDRNRAEVAYIRHCNESREHGGWK